MTKAILLPVLVGLLSCGLLPIWAYQWPLPTEQISQGFLARRPSDLITGENPLPNLGFWFAVDQKQAREGVVQPYHSGEIIYFETSSDMNTLGPIPRNIDNTILVQHEKLLFRYSSDNLKVALQDSYQVENQNLLFALDGQAIGSEKNFPIGNSHVYIEVFDTESQTVINPKLIMPSTDVNARGSQPYLEFVTASEAAVADPAATDRVLAAVDRQLKTFDQLLRGIYNLSFHFPVEQGPPLELSVSIDGKKIYSELFDQVYGINSKLIINDRDLQDIYILDNQAGKFFLGSINLQEKVNSLVKISVDEKYINGSHSINDYTVQIR